MHVSVLLYEGVRIFDVAVVAEVWGVDRSDCGIPKFTLTYCSDQQSVRSDQGAELIAQNRPEALAACDLVLVPGRQDPAPLPRASLHGLRAAHAAGVEIAALCGGAFALAQAGLLDGRRATTHWLLAERFRRDHPRVRFEQDRLFVEDGGIWTSAGTTAGIDLCLHLVRRVHGADTAAVIARRMITPPHRVGGQRQYIDQAVAARRRHEPFSATLDWVRSQLARAVTVRELAAHSGMPARTFSRRFKELTGTTPHQWMRNERIQTAQRLLETTDLPVQVIAQKVGFGTATTLRKHFAEEFRLTPGTYRTMFQARCPERSLGEEVRLLGDD